jgi:two-component system nitrogen regulation sensor histidine kinase NtrY
MTDEIKVERKYGFGGTAKLDPDLLQGVFLNVMLNAIQVMKGKGELKLITSMQQNNGKKYLRVSISDTGPGIPDEMKEQVFNPFFTRREDGTGLGLAIVLKVIQEHNATITIKDNKLQGAIFEFNFELG